jgi:uncharacterized membrane protein (DUF106 family)
MNHPLIGNIDHLTLEELQSKVSELTKKLSAAHRMGNAQLVGQVRLALDTYQSKYQEKQAEFWKSQSKPGNDYSDRIDIS